MDLDVIRELGFLRRDTEHYEFPRLCRFQDKYVPEEFLATLAARPLPGAIDNCLYIHVPFCSSICSFCNYFKVIDRDGEEKTAFIDALVKEIQTFGRHLHPAKRRIAGVHFGGGTPSLLDRHQFGRIIAALGESFDMSDCGLLSVEATVKSLANSEKVEELASVGFNRVSFGVQTLDPAIRKKLGVRFEQGDVEQVCGRLVRAGIADFNADLMYNLPHQDPNDVIDGMNALFAMGAVNIDLYFMNVYPDTNLERIMKRNRSWSEYQQVERQAQFGQSIYDFIDKSPQIRLLFSNTVSASRDRIQVTLSNALGNNRLDGGNMFALGPSARGFVDRYPYKNESDLEGYIQRVNKTGLGYHYGRTVTAHEAEQRLMVMFPNFTRIPKREIPARPAFEDKIATLLQAGVLAEDSQEIRIAGTYNFFGGNISALFQSVEEKQRSIQSYFLTRKHRLNLYNQDHTNIARQRDDAT